MNKLFLRQLLFIGLCFRFLEIFSFVGFCRAEDNQEERKPGRNVPRRFLEIIEGANATPYTQGSGRLELANSLASPHNPLSARVIVNRVWKWHFGQALVRTPSNFGILGEPPTHPELLDWLAQSFMQSGWSLKSLHRKIMLSATYRMKSTYRQEYFQHDGDNRLIWRMNPRKMEVEVFRDSLLSVTGELKCSLGGLQKTTYWP